MFIETLLSKRRQLTGGGNLLEEATSSTSSTSAIRDPWPILLMQHCLGDAYDRFIGQLWSTFWNSEEFDVCKITLMSSITAEDMLEMIVSSSMKNFFMSPTVEVGHLRYISPSEANEIQDSSDIDFIALQAFKKIKTAMQGIYSSS